MNRLAMKRLALLTSGGDAPGMNAAIRAIVRSADAAGCTTVGVHNGYAGLIKADFVDLDARAVSGILHLGGTMLGTARSKEFLTAEGRRRAIGALREAAVDGLIVIGGDGSMQGADALSREGDIAVVGLPGTIDNDLHGTDFTIGFDTAVNTALESIDRVRDTAASHGRLFFVEVMGRHSGWIALHSALAGGGTEVLVPERRTDAATLRSRIQRSFALGKRFCLVIVAEGDEAGGAFAVADRVTEGLDVDYRVVTLGHVQRGGAPSARDRVLASVLGDAAVQALLDGADRVMLGERGGDVQATPMEHTWTRRDQAPTALLKLMDRLAR